MLDLRVALCGVVCSTTAAPRTCKRAIARVKNCKLYCSFANIWRALLLHFAAAACENVAAAQHAVAASDALRAVGGEASDAAECAAAAVAAAERAAAAAAAAERAALFAATERAAAAASAAERAAAAAATAPGMGYI